MAVTGQQPFIPWAHKKYVSYIKQECTEEISPISHVRPYQHREPQIEKHFDSYAPTARHDGIDGARPKCVNEKDRRYYLTPTNSFRCPLRLSPTKHHQIADHTEPERRRDTKKTPYVEFERRPGFLETSTPHQTH